MKNNNSLYYRYFVYSPEEEERLMKNGGPNFKFGFVVKNGVQKRYTSIVLSFENVLKTNPQAQLIVEGDIRKIKYTPHTK